MLEPRGTPGTQEKVRNALLHHTSIQKRREDHRLVCRQEYSMVDRSQAAETVRRQTRGQCRMRWTARFMPSQRRSHQHPSRPRRPLNWRALAQLCPLAILAATAQQLSNPAGLGAPRPQHDPPHLPPRPRPANPIEIDEEAMPRFDRNVCITQGGPGC